MSRRDSGRVVAFAWVVMAWSLVAVQGALAHGPAPVALEALSLSGDAAEGLIRDDPGLPDVVRTNIGLAIARPDGAYHYGCPVQWGGVELAFAAATPDRSGIIALGGGRAYASVDGGCSFSELAWPDQAGDATNVERVGERFFITARDGTTGSVVQWQPGTAPVIAFRLGFAPDSLTTWSRSDATGAGLLVAGARPAATIESFAVVVDSGTDATTLHRVWSANLTVTGAQQLTLPNAPQDDAAWVVVTTDEGRGLWRRNAIGGGWSRKLGGLGSVHGPVALDEALLGLWDGKLWTHPGTAAGSWSPGPEVDWTCLQQLGDRVYACSLQQLSEVLAADGSSRPVFRLAQLAGPREGCPKDAPTLCIGDWFHFGGESQLVDATPATYPDPAGPPAEPLPKDENGCAAGSTNPLSGYGGGALLFAFITLRRRLTAMWAACCG